MAICELEMPDLDLLAHPAWNLACFGLAGIVRLRKVGLCSRIADLRLLFDSHRKSLRSSCNRIRGDWHNEMDSLGSVSESIPISFLVIL